MRTEFVERIKWHAKSICIFGIILSILPSIYIPLDYLITLLRSDVNISFNWSEYAEISAIAILIGGACAYIATVTVLVIAKAVENSEASVSKKLSKANKGD